MFPASQDDVSALIAPSFVPPSSMSVSEEFKSDGGLAPMSVTVELGKSVGSFAVSLLFKLSLTVLTWMCPLQFHPLCPSVENEIE